MSLRDKPESDCVGQYMAGASIRERTVTLARTTTILYGQSVRADLQEQGMKRVFIPKTEKKEHALSDFEKAEWFDQTDNCVRTISWKIA